MPEKKCREYREIAPPEEMNTIYKYPIDIVDKQTITMPLFAKPIHAGLDPKGVPCLWARVCNEGTLSTARLVVVYVVGTGCEMPEGAKEHVGSFVQGPFMWHVFTG